MNCSTEKKIVFWSFLGRDFICMWEKFQSSQSSNSGYLQKYPIFSTTNVPILFLCLDICIFTSEQTKKMHLVEKWVKCSHLLFIIFSLSNCNYSSIVQWFQNRELSLPLWPKINHILTPPLVPRKKGWPCHCDLILTSKSATFDPPVHTRDGWQGSKWSQIMFSYCYRCDLRRSIYSMLIPGSLGEPAIVT